MTPLQTAAQAVIARWESPKWKDEAPTAVVIGALRKALTDEQAQAVKPVATVQCINGVTIGYLDAMQPVGTKLYTHPAPPPAGERNAAQAMSNLLARIHRDGGHYESEHGQIKAIDDADLIVARLNALLLAEAREIAATERQVEILSDELSKCSKAQQVAVPDKREPLTFDQIDALENRVYMQTTHKGRPMFEYVNAIIRAVEAFHGIGAKP